MTVTASDHLQRRAAGLILAGGRSSRFGAEKAAAVLSGRALMLHVADRMARLPAVAVSARATSSAARHAHELGAALLLDNPLGPSGPLAGVLAGLDWASAESFDFLATAPCDAPLLPMHMVEILLDQIGVASAAFAATTAGDHPLCTVWRTSVRELLRPTLAAGHPSVRGFLTEIGAVRVMFHDPGAFANANTAAELARLELA